MSLLELRELSVAYGKTFRVGPATFSMDRGVLHIHGPNGGGKTTLMKAMSGGLVPAKGQVLVRGQDAHRVASARRDIAMVSAVPELPDFLSVGEAWRFAAAIRRAPDWDGQPYCEKLNLDSRLPLASASAGQRQKAELICGLAGDPAVLLLDEVFTHLDVASVEQLKTWIAEWSATRLVILTHHGESPVASSASLRVDHDRVEFV